MRTVAWDPLVNNTVTFLAFFMTCMRSQDYTQRGEEGTIPRGEERVLYPEGRGGYFLRGEEAIREEGGGGATHEGTILGVYMKVIVRYFR